MKILIALCMIFGVYSLSAQTELIRHKSHSGTNQNFKVAKCSGNLGLTVISGELEKDNASNYKLIYTQEGSSVTFTLFKTQNKTLTTTMCMTNDEVIEYITLSSPSVEVRQGIMELLVKELRTYRKLEKI